MQIEFQKVTPVLIFLWSKHCHMIFFKESIKQDVYLDLGFIIDSSASFKNHYALEKQFVKRVGRHFRLGKYKTRTALMTYSSYIDTVSKLSDFHSEEDFLEAVDSAPFMGSTSRLDKALVEANQGMFSVRNGGRVGVKQVLVVLTDGVSSVGIKDPFKIVKKIADQNIHVIVVAVGDSIKDGSLDTLGDQVFYIDDYAQLGSVTFSTKIMNAIAEQGKCVLYMYDVHSYPLE